MMSTCKAESLEELFFLLLHCVWRDFLSFVVMFSAFVHSRSNHLDDLLQTCRCIPEFESAHEPERQYERMETDTLSAPVEVVSHILTFVLRVLYLTISFVFVLQPCLKSPNHYAESDMEFPAEDNCASEGSPSKCDSFVDQVEVYLDKKASTHSMCTVVMLVILIALLVNHPQYAFSSACDDGTLSEKWNSIFPHRFTGFLKRDKHPYVLWNNFLQLNRKFYDIEYEQYPNGTRGDVCDSPSGGYSLAHQSLYSNTALLSNSTSTDSTLQYSASDYTFPLSYYWTAACTILFYLLGMGQLVFAKPLPVSLPSSQKTDIQWTKRDSSNLFRRAKKYPRSLVVSLQGNPNTGYCTVVAIGVPNTQEFCLLVDTGSSNMAVAAKKSPSIGNYFHTESHGNSYVSLHRQVSVTYSGGAWSGDLVRDVVSIGGSPQVAVDFALITSSTDFFMPGSPWVGILGLAYDSLAKPDSSVETFWKVLQKSSELNDMFALSLCPQVGYTNQGGILEFGDTSSTLYAGPIYYTTIVNEKYYEVLVTNLTVGGSPIDLHCSEFNNDKAIVDSGTTDIYLPLKVFQEVVEVFSKHFQDNVPNFTVPETFWNGGLKLAWPVEDRALLYSIFPTFYVGFALHDDPSMEFKLAVTPQIYLRLVSGSHEEQVETNCLPTCNFYIFGIKGREKGTVIGANVMLGFATVFDREKKRIGFAKSTCQYDLMSQEHLPHIVGPYGRDPDDCHCYKCSPGLAYWEYCVFVCGGVVFPISLLTIIYIVMKKMIKMAKNGNGCSRCRRQENSLRCVHTDSYNIPSQRTDSEPVTEEDVSSTSSYRLLSQCSPVTNQVSSISSQISTGHPPESEDDEDNSRNMTGDRGMEEDCSPTEDGVPCEEQCTSSLSHFVVALRYPSNGAEDTRCYVFNEPHKPEMAAIRDRPMHVGMSNYMSCCDKSDMPIPVGYKGIPKYNLILMSISWGFTLMKYCTCS